MFDFQTASLTNFCVPVNFGNVKMEDVFLIILCVMESFNVQMNPTKRTVQAGVVLMVSSNVLTKRNVYRSV